MTMQGTSNAANLDREVRLYVFRRTADTGTVPTITEIIEAIAQPHPAVEDALRRLAAERALVLSPSSPEIWMANPFSALPTSFRVTAGGRRYYGNCIWDALGIPAILDADARIETECGDCGEPVALDVAGGRLAAQAGLIHFAVPAAEWWVNIGYT